MKEIYQANLEKAENALELAKMGLAAKVNDLIIRYGAIFMDNHTEMKLDYRHVTNIVKEANIGLETIKSLETDVKFYQEKIAEEEAKENAAKENANADNE